MIHSTSSLQNVFLLVERLSRDIGQKSLKARMHQANFFFMSVLFFLRKFQAVQNFDHVIFDLNLRVYSHRSLPKYLIFCSNRAVGTKNDEKKRKRIRHEQ